MAWDGERYQQRFDELAAKGHDVHGEADFVADLGPRSVLDAGCGTGRVGIELARRGVEVVGVDVDRSMIEVARSRAPDLEWVVADLINLDLGRSFDVVVLAGNVPLFTEPGTASALVVGCARHVAPGGSMVAGFQLDGRFGLDELDGAAAGEGLILSERFSTWDRDPLPGAGSYAVSIHTRASG